MGSHLWYHNIYFPVPIPDLTYSRPLLPADPQQRLLLECAAEVLPAFGSSPPVAGRAADATFVIGAFVGASSTDYNKLALRYCPGALASSALVGEQTKAKGGGVNAFSATGASLSVAAGRLAYAFDLRGPTLTIDTGESHLLTLPAASARVSHTC